MLVLKSSFQSAKKFFSNVLEIFQVKLLPEVNKQVGGIISSAFFSKQNCNTTCGYIKSYNSISFLPIATKSGTMMVYIMNTKIWKFNLVFFL